MTYRSAARFYDLFGSKNDLNFYRNLAIECGNRALELGVGTARVAIDLARSGVMVVGIDNSDDMLSIAKEKLAKEIQSVRSRVILRKGDMRNFSLGQRFPFIYIPASTFDHNVSVEDRKRALSCVHKHLEKNGIFAFDLEQPGVDGPRKSWWVDREEVEDGKMVVRRIFTVMNEARRTLNLDLFYDVYQDGRHFEGYHEYGEVGIVSKEEVVELLEDNGFRVDKTYGDFEKSEYREDSAKIVLIAKKRH